MENFENNAEKKIVKVEQIFKVKELIPSDEHWIVQEILKSEITLEEGAILEVVKLSAKNKYVLSDGAKITLRGDSFKDEIKKVGQSGAEEINLDDNPDDPIKFNDEIEEDNEDFLSDDIVLTKNDEQDELEQVRKRLDKKDINNTKDNEKSPHDLYFLDLEENNLDNYDMQEGTDDLKTTWYDPDDFLVDDLQKKIVNLKKEKKEIEFQLSLEHHPADQRKIEEIEKQLKELEEEQKATAFEKIDQMDNELINDVRNMISQNPYLLEVYEMAKRSLSTELLKKQESLEGVAFKRSDVIKEMFNVMAKKQSEEVAEQNRRSLLALIN